MARPLRTQFAGAHYHVMNRGLDRTPVFENDDDHQRFTQLLQDVFERWEVRVFAYCCMTTHYHLFLQTPQGNISRVMRHVDGLYTQRFNRSRHRDGPLFRGRYKAVLVDADSYLLQLVRYIHLNPVEAGLAKTAGVYPWSSHRLYLSSRRRPAWLADADVMGHFSGRRAFERFVAEGSDVALKAFIEGGRRSPFLGAADFLSRAMERIAPSREHPRRERTPQFRTPQDVIQSVARHAGVGREGLLAGRPGRANLPRDLTILVSIRCAGFTRAEVRESLGLSSDSAITHACARAQRALSEDKDMRYLYRRITEQED